MAGQRLALAPYNSPMSALPLSIHSVAQVRAMDRYASEHLGIPGSALMTRAAEAALSALRSEWPRAAQIVVICGAGNNAGDGYVLARLASAERLQVTVMALGEPQALQGDARQAWQAFVAQGGTTTVWNPALLSAADVIVDALFGTGLSRPLDAHLMNCVQAINVANRPVLSLDVPSGLNADTGVVMGVAIRAQRTICFIGLKQGFYLAAGPNHVGKLLFDDLQLPVSVAEQVGCVAQRIDNSVVQQALPRRSRTSHKGQQGHVLIVGGGLGMAGAVRLAGEACLRVGSGLVTIATRPEHVGALLAGRPELMCRGVMTASELTPLVQRAEVIAIGPGLGQDTWARELFAAIMASNKPLVLDADALNLLAQQPAVRDHAHDNWLLTPHPGEAARLLSTNTSHVQEARLQAVHDLVEQYGGTVVLKGAGTLVLSANQLPALCDRGNPGMAAPGMGDVLTGIIAGIAAQCGDLPLAARAGVHVHAVAGDMAARHGERGLLASDLFAHLPSCVNP
jgi:ADP-dependent NAD(P)H-hydrate dehydratase / NAD(P)H-hydrate epimerase